MIVGHLLFLYFLEFTNDFIFQMKQEIPELLRLAKEVDLGEGDFRYTVCMQNWKDNPGDRSRRIWELNYLILVFLRIHRRAGQCSVESVQWSALCVSVDFRPIHRNRYVELHTDSFTTTRYLPNPPSFIFRAHPTLT